MDNQTRRTNFSGLDPEIQLLSSALVDQIAAGEVIERPASIVKELVENSLDAGATRIEVDIRAGGSALVAVQDNGVGMSAPQVRLAIQRHATSKIRSAEDLARIGSYGFRGEALPAIAAVSRMRILTREPESNSGHELCCEASQIQLDRAAGCPIGTRIEVTDLFARIPARRKFLKQPTTEWGHSIDWLGRLAMALPEVHFHIRRDDQRAIVWPSTSERHERVVSVLGESQAGSLISSEWQDAAGRVYALVSGPDQTRANANGIHLYVNGRPLRDKMLRHAVMEVYRDLLPRGRFPVAVVFLVVDPMSVDVNVHPAKWEVRFRNPQQIHQLIRHTLKTAMESRTHLNPAPWSKHQTPPPSSGWPRKSSTGSESSATDWMFAERPRAASDGGPHEASSFGEHTEILASEPLQFSSQRLLGQALARYLVLEGEGGLLLVDQHAAHERVLYERLRASWLEEGVARQGLLIPVTVELDPLALTALMAAQKMVEQLGFDLEPFGEASVVVRAIPELLAGSDPERLVRDLADELDPDADSAGANRASTRLLDPADRIFATLACHSARRFGDHLPEEEQKAILRGLDTIPWAPTCPHGRPVVARLGLSELDGRFGRR